MSGPRVEVIAVTRFLGVPEELAQPRIGVDQDAGSESARLIECAGRCCYDSYSKGRTSAAFHEHLLEVGHGSPLEHASISFYISGISRGCSHEWVRHRVGVAISQRSTRYVDESESEWCWHPALADADEVGDMDCLVRDARELYTAIVGRLEPVVGRKQARGAARGVLGNALSTALVWTANLRALRHVITMRASEAADGEIRLLANRLYEAARDECPEYFSDGEETVCADGIGYAVRWKTGT